MATLNLEDLEPGMVLAEDAKHHNGRVLLRAGTELTEKHIKIFTTWGLTEANIEGVSKDTLDAQATQDIDPEILAQAEKHIADRFRHTDPTHPAVEELMRICIKQLATITNAE